MKSYKRIMDIKEATFDSLEMLCNEEAKQGWRVIAISDGSIHRYATLEKEHDDRIENSERSGLQIKGSETGTGNAVVKTRASRDKTGTKG